MRVLFITRKYPPQTGGMENCMYGIITNFPDEKIAITLGKHQWHLIWFYPYAFIKALWILWTKPIDLIHLGDAVISPLGWLLTKLTGKTTVMTAYGLDINFGNKIYQSIMPYFYRKVPYVICISQATKGICIEYGIDASKIRIITPGINPEDWKLDLSKEQARKELENKYKLELKDKFIILSVGRISSRRKGFHWFVENVAPKLSINMIYLIVGSGAQQTLVGQKSEKEKIEESITKLKLENKVKLLGRLSHFEVQKLHRASDVHIMPNIQVTGDLEGFGMVCPEAAALGLPSIASRMEGMLDAVIENETGYYAETGNPNSFIEQFKRVNRLKPDKVTTSAIKHFDWKIIAKCYHDYFSEIIRDDKH